MLKKGSLVVFICILVSVLVFMIYFEYEYYRGAYWKHLENGYQESMYKLTLYLNKQANRGEKQQRKNEARIERE